MKLALITRMTRSASPEHAAVRHAYIGSAGSAVIALVYDLVVDQSFSPWNPIAVGIAAFLGWAIARELDPDHPLTALVALAGSALLAMWSAPLLLLSAVALGAFRLMAGSVGGPGPTTIDLVVIVGMAAYAGWHIEGWFLAMILVAGVVVGSGMLGVPWALAAAVAAVTAAIVSDTGPHPGDESARILAVPILILITLALALPAQPRSRTDIGKVPLDGRRVRAARVLAGLAVLAAVIASDVYGLTEIGPLTAAVVSTGLSALSLRRRGVAELQ